MHAPAMDPGPAPEAGPGTRSLPPAAEGAPREPEATSTRPLAPLTLGALLGVLAALASDSAHAPAALELALSACGLLVWAALAWSGRVPALARVPAALPLALALLPAALAAWRLPTTVSNDEQAVLAQARDFAHARLGSRLPRPACALVPGAEPARTGLCPLHRRQMLELDERDLRVSKYPPGTALAWTAGVLLGVPALGPALCALALVALCAALARRVGLADPWLVALCVALSPFVLLVGSSYQSELVSAPLAAAAWWALLRWREGHADRAPRPRALLPALVGASCGFALLARPLTGSVLSLACALGLLAPVVVGEKRAPRLRALALAALAGAPFVLLLLGHDRLVVGRWLAPPYDVYARRFGPFLEGPGGLLGEPLDVYGRGALLSGLRETLARWSIGLLGLLGAWLAGFVGLWRLRARDGGAGLALALGLPLAYALHWYPGHWAYPGPLYAYESVVPLAVGLFVWLRSAPLAWTRALPLALVVAAAPLALVRWSALERHARLRFEPERLAAELPAEAVLLLPPEPGLKLWLPSTSAREAGPVRVYELASPAATRAALAELGLAGRPTWRVVPGDAGEARLVRVE